jgi:hypothetical protein
MANKWRNDDFNRWTEEEIRRSRAASGRYDEPRQYSQEFGSSAQYGNDSDYRTDRDWQRRERERTRSDMARQYEQESFAQPGTFYYGGPPVRRFGLGPAEPAFEGENAPDTYGRSFTRTPVAPTSSYSGYGYAADPAGMDEAFREVGRFEREMTHEDDHPHHHHARGRGMFHDDPNRGPIDRLRNWMNHRGKGPKGYARSDERIREDISDHLTQDYLVDATNIEVAVVECECTLNGTVGTRDEKRRAEDIAERVMGVKHVQNNLRVAPTATTALSTQDRTGTMSTTIGTNPTLSANRSSSSY